MKPQQRPSCSDCAYWYRLDGALSNCAHSGKSDDRCLTERRDHPLIAMVRRTCGRNGRWFVPRPTEVTKAK